MRRKWQNRLGLAGLALLLGAGVSPGSPPTLPLLVMPLQTDLRGAEKIGSRRTGMICAPAGRLTWRDVEPTSAAAQEAIARGLRIAGRPAYPSGGHDGDEAIYRIEATIVAVRMNGCVAQHGLTRLVGGRRTSKYDGRMTVRWAAIHRKTRRTVAEATFDQPIDAGGRDMGAADAIVAALVASADTFGRSLTPQ